MKNLLLAFAFACLAIPSFGQFSLGLSASVNNSYWKWHIISLNHDIDYKSDFGYRAALMGEYRFSRILTARAEFGTQKKANSLAIDVPDGTGINIAHGFFNENYRFWEGSLLVQISPLKKVSPLYLLLGGTYGRLSNGWQHVEGVVFSDGKHVSKIDLDPTQYNLNSVASDFGLGWNVQLGASNQIKIEGRFQYTLTDFSSHENVDAKASPLMLTVGYLHRL